MLLLEKGSTLEPVPAGDQVYVIRLPAALARRARNLLDSDGSSYRNLSELAAVALENQLALETDDGNVPAAASSLSVRKDVPETLLIMPEGDVPVAKAVTPSAVGLFMLTNRLAPFPAVLRMLVNMSIQEPPLPNEFLAVVGRCARELGLRLKAGDQRGHAKGITRRATAWPTGADPVKSIERFAMSFLVLPNRAGGVSGPLLDLGLVAQNEFGRLLPTEAGLHLARLPNPLLEERASDSALSDEQAALLRGSLRNWPAESAAIDEFIAVAHRSPDMRSLDSGLAAVHRDWTQSRVSAHRAAMVGRLMDAGVLQVEGRAPNARVALNSAVADFFTIDHHTGR